jgi:site-specific DNA recombinase
MVSPKRVGLLARVSTGDQTNGTSPDDQLQRGRAYSLSRGYSIVAEELDVISGTFILARSAFNRYLEMMAEGKLDAIVVDIPDRLGRGDAIAKCELLAQLNGGQIEYATPGRDDTTVEGMARKATDMLVSGIERINIRRRTMGGRNAWARRGRVIATAFRPYGYEFHKTYDPSTGRKLNCELRIVDAEAQMVTRIFEWCAFEGLTTYAIAKRLTELHVPTLSDVDRVNKRKRGAPGEWHKDTVHGILKNRTYVGEWRYRKNQVARVDTADGVKTKITRRDVEESIPIQVPAIVSGDLWDLAQSQLQENARRNFKPTRHRYLLRGRLRCARCGGPMVGWTREFVARNGLSSNWHYRCSHRYPRSSPSHCDTRNIEGPLLENIVWSGLAALLLDEKALFDNLETERKEAKRARRIIQQSLVALEVQTRKDADRLNRLLDLYTTGEIEKSVYVAKKGEIEQAIQKRNTETAELRARLAAATGMDPDREAELRRLRAVLVEKLDGATFEQKLQLLAVLGVQCIYDDETEQVMLSGAFGDQRLSLPNDDTEGGAASGGGSSASATFESYRPARYKA